MPKNTNLLPQLIEAALSLPDGASPEERVAAVREVLDSQNGVDLAQLEEAVLEACAAVSSEDGEAPSDDQLTELERLADVADAVRTRRGELKAAADARAERARAIAERVNKAKAGAEPEGGDPAAEIAPEGGDPAAEIAPEGGAPVLLPEGTPAPIAEPVSASLAKQIAAQPARTLAPAPIRVPLNQDPAHLPQGRQQSFSVVASSDVPGFPAGGQLPDLSAMSSAVMAKMRTLGSTGMGTNRQSILQIRRNAAAEFTMTGAQDDWLKVTKAGDEKRLSGGSLTAALGPGGGWCAPSEILYDLCPTASTDGLLDVPSVVASRGGIKWPNTPDFSAIYTGTGWAGGWDSGGNPLPAPAGGIHFVLSEDQVGKIANDPAQTKPCYLIPCPDFSECRLEVVGLCLKAGILTQHAYPELITYFLEQAMIAHVHRMNAELLNKMVSTACPVDIPMIAAGTAPAPPAVATQAGYSATSTLLGAIELQAMDLRYKYRWGATETLEVVLPMWGKGIIRSDISKRMGIDDPFNVSDQQMTDWFAKRALRVQWVYDWQDSLNPGPITTNNPDTTHCAPLSNPVTYTFGGPAPATAWPNEIHALVYKAGTFIRAVADVITIDGLYDSATLQHNVYTALFMEEGLCVIKKCFEARLVRAAICPTGGVGPFVTTTCAGTV